MEMKVKTLICLMLGLMASCSFGDTHLTDNYYIFAPGELNESYTLGCKLGSSNDVNIDSIGYVKWNEKVIIARRTVGDKPWLVVKARDERLKSCNNDTIFYPLSDMEADLITSCCVNDVFQEKHFE